MAAARRPRAEGKPLAPTRPIHSFDRPPRPARVDPRLSDRAYRVLVTLEAYCWGESRECWVSNRTLAEQSGGAHPDTIRRALRQLEALGYLTTTPDPSKVRGQRIQLLYDLAGPRPVQDPE